MKIEIIAVTSFLSASFLISCSNTSNTSDSGKAEETNGGNLMSEANMAPDLGLGKFKNVELTHPLDAKMLETAKGIYNGKCITCHKLTGEKLVGPGWKGVTQRRKPEWILNFVTNTDEMIEKNATAKSLYEVCLVKMPNQALGDGEARSMLEYMRQNDGEK